MMSEMNKVMRLRNAMSSGAVLVVPTAYDALSARVIEEAGFQAVHVGGFLGAGSLLGLPDVGLLTMSEAMARASNIAAVIEPPVIMDIDNGYGNAINARRTVIEAVRGGIAAVHMEDQVFPKRCGQYGMGDMKVVDAAEMVGKIRAARDVAGPDDLYLIARTDALGAGLSVDDALARMFAYVEAGADAVLPITRNYEWLKEIGRRWNRSAPLVTAPTRFSTVPAEELRQHGFQIILYTEIAVRAALHGVRRAMQELAEKGGVAAIENDLVPTEYLYELVRLPHYRELEVMYGAVSARDS
jgi:2-methylisocitrate lyase-like PEP mutase family enzyme